MSLYDPSLALPSPPDSWVPIVSWSHEYRETTDAKIAEPIKGIHAADQHTRFQIRTFIVQEQRKALRTLVSQFHRLHVAGLVNVDTLVDPSRSECAEAKQRFDKEPELYRLARRVADCRGFLNYLNELDTRDGVSSAPRVAGNASPGITATGNTHGTSSFMPFGLR